MTTLIALRALALEQTGEVVSYWDALWWGFMIGLLSCAELKALEQQAQWADRDERDQEIAEQFAAVLASACDSHSNWKKGTEA